MTLSAIPIVAMTAAMRKFGSSNGFGDLMIVVAGYFSVIGGREISHWSIMIWRPLPLSVVRGVARSRYSSINLTCRIPSSHLRLYRLSTAEILYWMPDHPSVLQSFVWQQYDKPPEFPELHRFLGFWKDNIDATLHSRQWAEMPGIPQPMRF